MTTNGPLWLYCLLEIIHLTIRSI